MAEPKILWRLVMEATIASLRGESRGQYDIRLGRPEDLAEFFAGVPRTGVTTRGGFTLNVPLEPYVGGNPVPAESVRVRYMGPGSRRKDWYIASQRPNTAYPLWRIGRGLLDETEPNTDYAVIVRGPDERFHARWITPGVLSRLPSSVREEVRAADSGWSTLSAEEWEAVEAELEIPGVVMPTVGTLAGTDHDGEGDRDELLLLLDAYLDEGRAPEGDALDEIIDEVARVSPSLTAETEARTVTVEAVFARLDDITEERGADLANDPVTQVYDEFAADRDGLRAVAEAIRSNLDSPDAEPLAAEELGVIEAAEGRLLTTVHLRRERSRSLRASKIAATGPRPGCEACGFDFEDVYGQRGRGFVECHHIVPLAELRPDSMTSVADLALLCANCHRMIHVARPWLTVDELRDVVQGQVR